MIKPETDIIRSLLFVGVHYSSGHKTYPEAIAEIKNLIAALESSNPTPDAPTTPTAPAPPTPVTTVGIRLFVEECSRRGYPSDTILTPRHLILMADFLEATE